MKHVFPGALLVATLLAVVAVAEQSLLDLLTSMASALSGGNPAAFLDAVDPDGPDYEILRTNVTALLNQAEVLASIEVIKEEGDDKRRRVELDWFLEIRPKQETASLERRRERVDCRLERKKKRWKVVGLDPVELFVPPKPP